MGQGLLFRLATGGGFDQRAAHDEPAALARHLRVPVREFGPVPQHVQQPAHGELLAGRFDRRLVVGERGGRQSCGAARQREAEPEAGLAAFFIVDHGAAAHLAHAGKVVGGLVVVAGGGMARARSGPAREHVALVAVGYVERKVASGPAFAQHRHLARIGFGQKGLQAFSLGNDLPEHTVSLDHGWCLQFLAIDAARSTSRVSPLSVMRGPAWTRRIQSMPALACRQAR